MSQAPISGQHGQYLVSATRLSGPGQIQCREWPGWRGDGGKFDGYTGNALPSCCPIRSRRNTIYAIVPHYEDYVSLLVVADPVAGGWNPSRPVPV